MHERRKYFRIDDAALIKYRVIQEDVLEEERRLLFMNYVRLEGARDVMLTIDTRLTELLLDVRAESPRVAELIELMNRKLSLVERMVRIDDPGSPRADYPEHVLREVNLSASGIAIVADSPIAAGAHLEIDLLLLPHYHHIKAFGRIMDCRRNGSNVGYVIAVDYEHIREEDRERIVQHVMRKQSELLKKQHGAAL